MRKYLDRLTFIAVLLLEASAALAKDGAAIYKSQCAACHGTLGEGKAGPKPAGASLS
jgi:mono/diheme cytochrome c family protein